MRIDRLDHFVLTVASIERTCDFYTRVLGMEVTTFGARRRALLFGQQKINLHQAGRELEPKARLPTPGSADFCLIASTPSRTSSAICSSSMSRLRKARWKGLARLALFSPFTSVIPMKTCSRSRILLVRRFSQVIADQA